MFPIVCSSQGAILNHQNASHMSVRSMNNTEEYAESNVFYRWRADLYCVYTPFYMDSQAARIQKQENIIVQENSNACERLSTETSADKKRARKRKLCLNDDRCKISELLKETLPSLLSEARDHNILFDFSPEFLSESNNNSKARHAAAAIGCGDVFQELCESSDTLNYGIDWSLRLDYIRTTSVMMGLSSVINRLIHNDSDSGLSLTLNEHTFLIPPQSRFLSSNLSLFLSHLYSYIKVEDGYDVIVIDPPWTNKSVKRKRSYQSLLETELCDLPIESLTKPGSLIVVWITNNTRIETCVKEVLFPKWNVEHVADWTWMKVTLTGEPVLDLHSHHKKPFERVVIGKIVPSQLSKTVKSVSTEGRSQYISSDSRCSTANGNHSSIILNSNPITEDSIQSSFTLPQDYILLSVPNALHSKKPSLKDVLEPYLPPNPKCLELFARNLLPGWTSWGNEPLRHQHLDFFEKCS